MKRTASTTLETIRSTADWIVVRSIDVMFEKRCTTCRWISPNSSEVDARVRTT